MLFMVKTSRDCPHNHAPVILGQLLAQMGRSLGEQIAQLVIGAALDCNLRPLRPQRRLQAGIAVDHCQGRCADIALDHPLQQRAPRCLTFLASDAHIHDDAAAISAYAQGHQHRYPSALFADSHAWIPAVHKYVANLCCCQITLRPGAELITQPPDQP